MKKRNLLIAAGVAAAGICIWLIARPSKGAQIRLETAPVSHITIRNSVTATGTVEPVTQVEVGTQVSGIIDKLYADYNGNVPAATSFSYVLLRLIRFCFFLPAAPFYVAPPSGLLHLLIHSERARKRISQGQILS